MATGLVIYGIPHSPYCIALAEILDGLGLEFRMETVPAWDRREILRLTDGAYYEVPLLMDGDEAVFESGADSQDIVRHVDRSFVGGRLFPERLEGLHDLVLGYLENEVEAISYRLFDPFHVASFRDPAERGMVVRHKERKFGKGCVERWESNAPQLWEDVGRVLDPLGRMLGKSPFLLGREPVYADYLLSGILGNIVYGGFLKLPESWSGLTTFRQHLAGFRFE
jgi:glutathione S-transferase